jgi:cytochrome o ubiquinol oxidase operon protein cyoD
MKTLRTYQIGFIISVLLTLAAAYLIWLHEATLHQFPTHEALYVSLTALAVLQLLAQISFFLHVDQEEEGKWGVVSLLLTSIIVCILIGGTLWVMSNLAPGHSGQVPFLNSTITPQNTND